MRLPKSLVAAICCLTITGSTAILSATPPEQIPELRGKLIESYSEVVNTSGVLLVGLVLGNAGNQIVPGDIRLKLPNQLSPRNLCLSVISQDGVYSGRAKMKRPRRTAGMHRLQPFDESAHKELIESATSDSLAIRVAAKRKCAGELDRELIPVILNPSYNTLFVLLNSKGALRTQVSIESKNRVLPGNCKGTRHQRSTAFDTICEFNTAALANPGLRSFKIVKIPRSGPRRTFVYDVHI